MSRVTYPEIAFLQLVGRRILQKQQEAAARGERYHDLSAPAPLQCGVLAKYRFEEIPGGHMPVVQLRGEPLFSPGELKEIAAEILEGPTLLRVANGADLEYVLERHVERR